MNKAKCLLLSAIIIFMFSSCKAQKESVIKQVDETGSDLVLEDSVLNNLRNNNDIVIAYAIENFAWVRSIHYKILAQKNGEWNGYVYTANLMKQHPSQTVSSVNINKKASDSLVDFILQTKAWEIKGDSGTNFCKNESKNCNINDAASARLWIITKKVVINLSYYAPEFYEECCPEKERALFLSIKQKIENIVIEKQPGQAEN